MKKFRWLLILCAMLSPSAWGQEIESIPKTMEAPQEAFLEDVPLAEFGFDEAWANGKEQRLREHYLRTPLGKAAAADVIETDQQKTPATQVDGTEAGIGVRLIQNRALVDAETSNQTSNVCEPSIAVRGQEILYTGNWFSAFSRDGGVNFKYRNPATSFPAIRNRAFCCDQVALYVPSHDLMVWFLQYGKDTTGNTVRLAVAGGADIAAERWRFYDFTPQNVGNWNNEWFDYPDLAYSNQFLFVTTNCFTLSDSFSRSVCLRIPLSELASYAALNYRFINVTDVGSLRPTQGAKDTMFIGTHENTSSLRVYSWPDASTSITRKSLAVQSWVRGGATAVCPDGRDWLGFVDGRITAAWTLGQEQGFAWTSAQGGNFAFPNVRVAVVNYGAGSVSSQPHIWNESFAFAYPATAVNNAGNTGICLSYGGNSLYPNSAVGLKNGNAWALTATSTGTHGPDRNRWGDYQAVRVNGGSNRFAASVFSLSGGPARGDIVPRLVQFDAISTASDSPQMQPVPVALTDHEELDSFAEVRTMKEKVVGYRFNAKLLEVNLQTASKFHQMADAISNRELASSNTTVISFSQLDTLDKYNEIARLPDIGQFFFDPPQTVCDPDERQQVLDTAIAPWNGICQLIITLPDGRKARGTGWMMTPHVVVTAGHCLHSGEAGDFFPQIEVIPAMNGPTRPFGSQVAPASNLRVAEGWRVEGKVADDYGVIRLEQPFLGVTLTPVAALTDDELRNSVLSLAGYPADKPAGTQWMHYGNAEAILSNRLRYMIDTYGGHSGSAVTTLAGSQRVAVGIHNYGGCPNKCTRITQAVIDDIKKWETE